MKKEIRERLMMVGGEVLGVLLGAFAWLSLCTFGWQLAVINTMEGALIVPVGVSLEVARTVLWMLFAAAAIAFLVKRVVEGWLDQRYGPDHVVERL